MSKKLFRVDVQYSYVAYVENPKDAIYFAPEALMDENKELFDVEPLISISNLPDGWTDGSYVYATKEDLTIREILKGQQ